MISSLAFYEADVNFQISLDHTVVAADLCIKDKHLRQGKKGLS